MGFPLKQSDSIEMPDLVGYLTELVSKETGNVLGQNQLSMVNTRLQKRMLTLGSLSAKQYLEYFEENKSAELSILVGLLTTHHTFFFREFIHFEYLLDSLETIVGNVKKRGERKIRIYSAACSKGHEAYSLSMFFRFHLTKIDPEMTYEIVGTDIDPQCIEHAKNGVYRYDEIKEVPMNYLTGCWQRGTGEIEEFVKAKEEIKANCKFGVKNLLNISKTDFSSKFDVILCRNVFIYFEIPDVERIAKNLGSLLHDGGYLISGLSESLKQLNTGMVNVGPSVYSFAKAENAPIEKASNVTPIVPTPKSIAINPNNQVLPKQHKKIRVFCVDDSTSVLKLMTKIFSNDKDFELVGTAQNGIEAHEFLQKNSVDVMTLDIHMPEMDGVEYLKKYHNSSHPKVIVVSSASREDANYAQKTMEYGACDFIEKPALNNLKDRADEIKAKLKTAYRFSTPTPKPAKIDKSFENEFIIQNPENKARIFIVTHSNNKTITEIIKDLRGDQPPIFLVYEGSDSFLPGAQSSFEKAGLKNVSLIDEANSFSTSNIYVCDFKRNFNTIVGKYKNQKVSICIFGSATEKAVNSLSDFANAQILLEENEYLNEDLREVVSDIFPATSFGHVGTEFLAKD